MDFYESNKRTLVNHFLNGAKSKESLGLELEHIVVRSGDGRSVTFYENGGVEEILNALAPYYTEKIYSEGRLIGLKRDKCLVSLEPAAQFEVSLGEYGSAADFAPAYRKFFKEIQPILRSFGLEFALCGYQPLSRARDLPLIPKLRYRMMDEYFRTTGSMGINMMRGTAATQVSVDYASEADFIKKFRLANALTPIFAFITDNARVFEGRKAERMTRTRVWEDIDRDRSMFADGALSKSRFGFSDYADYILNAPAILVSDGGALRYTGAEKIRDIYRERVMTDADAEHVLSMFFPYVRLKSFIEIRMADSMPIKEAAAFAALIEGVFYGGDTDSLLRLFDGVTDADAYAAFEEFKSRGADAEVYGRPFREAFNTLIATASKGLANRGEKNGKILLPLIQKTTVMMRNTSAGAGLKNTGQG
ncbi:MAG: hypothetical protein LBC13_03780 [Clostridiales bacterium]|jgi:glutamate--cysteine ligase|nr:hypothetical protein [Clostridiales bacterium]